MVIIATVFVVMVMAFYSIVFWTLRNGISPMPSTAHAKAAIFDLLKEVSLEHNGDILELGAGWGGVAFSLAKAFPHHKVVAIENSPVPFLVCKLRSFFFPLPNLEFRKGDIYSFPLEDSALVFCYLYPGAMAKLKDKFDDELCHHSWVISSTFAIPKRKVTKEVTLNDLYRTKIYLYEFP